MSKITIRILARQLGLSVGTVSKAFKDSHEISAGTKKRVLDRAAELNYIPNPYASSLRKQKSKTIAVILPEIADNFFSLAINGIQAVAAARHYHVLIYLSHESFEIEKQSLQHCFSGRVDGVLISVSSETKDATHIEQFKNEQVPLVFFDRDILQFAAPKVVTNDYECGREAALHLVSRKSKHPVFLSSSESLSICHKRNAGFTDALKELGITSGVQHYVIDCSGDNTSISGQLEKLLKENPQIDGIVASVEKLAIQTYFVCQATGLKIPKDIKVVAFSTLETASILSPSLTTISQPAFEIGRTAAEMLFDSINKKWRLETTEATITLPSLLIPRNST
ncbi:MAG: LacI family DNA-binding transcriptional regulator [Niabella sp.]|nr:LacI family DNA-binding transcriptional regulator [Niabella sp.]